MTLNELLKDNYVILNGKITDFSFQKYKEKLVCKLTIKGDNWVCTYGNFDIFNNNIKSKELILNLLDTIDIQDIIELKDQYVRIAVKKVSDPVDIIGNIISDKWFSLESYIINNPTINPDTSKTTEEKDNNKVEK